MPRRSSGDVLPFPRIPVFGHAAAQAMYVPLIETVLPSRMATRVILGTEGRGAAAAPDLVRVEEAAEVAMAAIFGNYPRWRWRCKIAVVVVDVSGSCARLDRPTQPFAPFTRATGDRRW